MIAMSYDYQADPDDLRSEFRRVGRPRCSDGMCGADDCARCNPGGEGEREEEEEEEVTHDEDD